jgi:hypothetical protein
MFLRLGIYQQFCAMVCIAMLGCNRAPVYVPDSDERMQYLADYYPSLKTIHDQLIFESLNCWRNIRSLKTKRDSFHEKEVVEMVSAKIREIEEQKTSLDLHVKRIQTEAEKGIAYRMFQTIDGGGTRPLALQELEQECANTLARVQESAAVRREEIDSLPPGFIPTKVILVRPPKVVPVVNNQRLEWE